MSRLLLVSAFLISCNNNDNLNKSCPMECYSTWYDGYHLWIEPSTKGVGQCKAGKPICDKDNNQISCEGEILPSYEVCDGIDNDCDGMTDESSSDDLLVVSDERDVCGKVGECARYNSICVNGEFVCAYQRQEEICDNKDNNCNGAIDEDIGNNELCFDDEYWKATNGTCRAGVVRCLHGNMRCDGQILPSREICDEEDNDCNGIVDDTGQLLSNKYDVVIAIDTSASMCPYTQAVSAALWQYIDQFQNNDNFRWSLVDMSKDYTNPLYIISDFTDISTIQTMLSSIGCNGGSSEASLDVLYETCSHLSSVELELSWRDEANGLVFSFTDEYPQTYSSPPTERFMITDACLEHGVLPFQWSLNPFEFAPIVEEANGLHFPLSNNWENIFNNLNSIVVSLCGE